MKITDWASEDRPREKMLDKGREVLSNAELLAILLRTGSAQKTAVQLAQELLQKYDNSLLKLGQANIKELLGYESVGLTKATTIHAALELGKRRMREESFSDNEPITCSRQIFERFRGHLSELPHEELWALYLSRGGKVLHSERISQGGTDFSGADVKIIVRPALQYLAGCVALCHNHPHGALRPSREDIAVTKQVTEALRLFDIRLIDHIIISDSDYYSFADNGNL